MIQMGVGLAHATSGHRDRAAAALQALIASSKARYIPATYIAILHAGMGDIEAAFDWLDKAYAERADGLSLINVEPMVDALRPDPRFGKFVERMGFKT